MHPFEFEEQMHRLSSSLMKPSISEKSLSFLFKEVSSMDAGVFKDSIELMMKEQDRNFMPKLTELFKYYNTVKKDRQAEIARSSEDERSIPVYIENRTDHEVGQEFERWKSFYEAYPYPDYPVGATKKQCEAIDNNYQDIMRKNGFDPEEVDPKANKLFIMGLMDLMFINTDNLPYDKKTTEGRPWKESLSQYQDGRNREGMSEAKGSMVCDWF